jgi:hypothetical protein
MHDDAIKTAGHDFSGLQCRVAYVRSLSDFGSIFVSLFMFCCGLFLRPIFISARSIGPMFHYILWLYMACNCVHYKAVPLHAMEALGGRGDIAPTHSRPRH